MLLGITEALNRMSIVPTWITTSMPGTWDEIRERYATSARYSVKKIPAHCPKTLTALHTILFNRDVVRICCRNNVDQLINSTNTVQGFENYPKVISYVQFPREVRASSSLQNIHDPQSHLSVYNFRWWIKRLNRLVYSLGKLRKDHLVFCNSEFSRSAFLDWYGSAPTTAPVGVLYPFADDVPQRQQIDSNCRKKVISSLGRFCPYKRQLEQVQLATNMPDWQFNIMGHTSLNGSYYRKVKAETSRNQHGNVNLLPNLPYSEIENQLSQSRFFLHSTTCEPFGLVIVEAILRNCVPIVHDSGGQREIVPFQKLRFSNLMDVPRIADTLDNKPELSNELQEKLQKRSRDKFVKEEFIHRFTEYFLQSNNIDT